MEKTMKTTKLFLMTAVALTTVACSNDILSTVERPADGITITATLPAKAGTETRALSEGSDKIVSSWAADEHLAVLYEADGTKHAADAIVKMVDGETGAATIEFTVNRNTAEGAPCTLIYPFAAANKDHTGLKDVDSLLAVQDGTLCADIDVRVGEGNLHIATPGLAVTKKPAAQFSIFKFTLNREDASSAVDVKSLAIAAGTRSFVVTPPSTAKELFVALPPMESQTVIFNATDPAGTTYSRVKEQISFTAGNYYQSQLSLTPMTYTLPWSNNVTTVWW